ncbi:hypothetical protein AC579_3967 [Pseudocercospora musae]|uniref:PRISE-like Rossmann-fold domain-containing protein n=2 Tax=Pseudocercospora musae TaxID=113226 RepID=A0A139HLT5_9PEZI|nr:hypothetical protein AC579_3967 [Pseudocercospora musae]KXT03400.1 hypothetical protein AC579_3967 [Pseudocercospora musae]
MKMSTQVIRSEGIYHGLPTYPNDADYTGLTALVTGANGISGYHQVKVLSRAPERWAKIYCLSRRPPPSYFFDGLGEGVEHVEADFLAKAELIAEQLDKKKIRKVDYVFFFSYTQPRQKGGVLGMWADADALAEVNNALIANFTGALKLANLKPKRFLLQTGAKQYGFHIGPATTPSFETDPRITIESNFYYPQEDTLSAYGKDQGVGWNVMRPSYIIGAVRDNLLNHMVGFAVYASVCAHLKQPLLFPADYVAWDKEYCQSSAMLNSYMNEWAVLTPEAKDEAFNVQDGLSFTWGRFWPYLASWYGTKSSPPENDDEKYQTFKYGPQGQTRCVFSLMEWAQKPEVQKAWQELKEKHGLLLEPFKDAAQIFGITDSAVIGGWPLSLSMRKARKLGFHGTVDSFESAFHSLSELAALSYTPPLVVKEYVEVVD